MRRIVCSAVLIRGNLLLVGPRHWDQTMHNQWRLVRNTFDEGALKDHEQGFIDQHGAYLSRTEAWPIAEAAGQILKRCGGDDTDGGTLYSENLY